MATDLGIFEVGLLVCIGLLAYLSLALLGTWSVRHPDDSDPLCCDSISTTVCCFVYTIACLLLHVTYYSALIHYFTSEYCDLHTSENCFCMTSLNIPLPVFFIYFGVNAYLQIGWPWSRSFCRPDTPFLHNFVVVLGWPIFLFGRLLMASGDCCRKSTSCGTEDLEKQPLLPINSSPSYSAIKVADRKETRPAEAS